MEKMLPLVEEVAKAGAERSVPTEPACRSRPSREEKLKPAPEGAKLTKKVVEGQRFWK